MKIIHNVLKDKEPIIVKSAKAKDRMECIKYLMSFHLIFKYHFLNLDETKALDCWADMKLIPLQISVSTITMFANDGKIVEAVNFYKEQVNDISNN